LSAYQAVDDFEAATMRDADAWMARLQQGLLEAERTKSSLDAVASRRKLNLLVMMTLGSTLLLGANLMSEKPAAPAPGEASEAPEDLAAAERLIELAIRESARPGKSESAEGAKPPAA